MHRQIQLGLSQLSREVVLVLDDVSEVRSDDVHEQFGRLFRHESPLRVVLVSRVEPRCRCTGSGSAATSPRSVPTSWRSPPTEACRAADPSGRPASDAAESGAPARPDRRVGRRPAPRRDVPAPTRRRLGRLRGIRPGVADYLLGEVVADQSPQTWQFLLRTSLVPRICGDLADTLTGQATVHCTLDALERDNAFVTALGPERRWYRYHPLLSEMLRRQLELERPESIPELHERAAHWFAAERPAHRRGETCCGSPGTGRSRERC